MMKKLYTLHFADDQIIIIAQDKEDLDFITTRLCIGIDNAGSTECEIEESILRGRKVIGWLNSILWPKNISHEKKHLIYNSIFKSVVLYGCETGQLIKNSAERSRVEKVTNDQIRDIMHVAKTITDEIQRI